MGRSRLVTLTVLIWAVGGISACGSSMPSEQGNVDGDRAAVGAVASPQFPTATPGMPPPLESPDCAGDSNCACVVDNCLALPVDAAVACDIAQGEAPECLALLLGAYSEGGCGADCNGQQMPALDDFCHAEECASLQLLLRSISIDPCTFDCSCEPDCVARSCGDDGCGGTCGGCGLAEECESGNCVESVSACDQNPQSCACAIATCLPIATEFIPASALCEASFLPATCATTLHEAFLADGCGEQCKGLTVPGLEALCDMPECEGFLDLGSLLNAPNLCQCYCEPQCDGKECGDDGCGGDCGLCPGSETCGFGECLEVVGSCTGDEFNCFCAVEECGEAGSLGPETRLCSDLWMGYPECYATLMRSYAADGCSGEKISYASTEALCGDPVCQGYRDLVSATHSIELCPPP